MPGHPRGAAGSLELALTTLGMVNGLVPPTANHFEADAENDLDYVPREARSHRFDIALSNSFGFGGTNACIAIGKV